MTENSYVKTHTTINVDRRTRDKLEKMKRSKSESFDSVINRLMEKDILDTFF